MSEGVGWWEDVDINLQYVFTNKVDTSSFLEQLVHSTVTWPWLGPGWGQQIKRIIFGLISEFVQWEARTSIGLG